MLSSSTISRSTSSPSTVVKPSFSDSTVRHRFASATAPTSSAFAATYGLSSHSRRADAGCGSAFPAARAASSATSRSSEYRLINSWALAESASASSGKVVDSALASSARTRESIFWSTPRLGIAVTTTDPGRGPILGSAGSASSIASTSITVVSALDRLAPRRRAHCSRCPSGCHHTRAPICRRSSCHRCGTVATAYRWDSSAMASTR